MESFAVQRRVGKKRTLRLELEVRKLVVACLHLTVHANLTNSPRDQVGVLECVGKQTKT